MYKYEKNICKHEFFKKLKKAIEYLWIMYEVNEEKDIVLLRRGKKER